MGEVTHWAGARALGALGGGALRRRAAAEVSEKSVEGAAAHNDSEMARGESNAQPYPTLLTR